MAVVIPSRILMILDSSTRISISHTVKGNIVSISNKTYFRSIILSIERVRNIVLIKGVSLVRTNLSIYLRGNVIN